METPGTTPDNEPQTDKATETPPAVDQIKEGVKVKVNDVAYPAIDPVNDPANW